MPFFVEVTVLAAGVGAIRLGRNDGGLTCFAEDIDHPFVGVECSIGDQDIGVDSGKEGICPIQIMGLARRKMESGGIAESIDSGVDFRAQSAS